MMFLLYSWPHYLWDLSKINTHTNTLAYVSTTCVHIHLTVTYTHTPFICFQWTYGLAYGVPLWLPYIPFILSHFYTHWGLPFSYTVQLSIQLFDPQYFVEAGPQPPQRPVGVVHQSDCFSSCSQRNLTLSWSWIVLTQSIQLLWAYSSVKITEITQRIKCMGKGKERSGRQHRARN